MTDIDTRFRGVCCLRGTVEGAERAIECLLNRLFCGNSEEIGEGSADTAGWRSFRGRLESSAETLSELCVWYFELRISGVWSAVTNKRPEPQK